MMRRFDIYNGCDNPSCWFRSYRPDGDYVEYDDHAAEVERVTADLNARIAELKVENAQEKAWLDKLAFAARMYKQHESGETRAELRFAYRDALLAIAMDAP